MKKLFIILVWLNLILFLGGCSIFQSENTKKENQTQTLGDSNEISISSRMGDIKIFQCKGDVLSFSAVKRVKVNDKDLRNKIMDNINIHTEIKGKKVIISALTKDNLDVWKWKQENYNSANISIDYELRIPEKINIYTVNTGMGNIDLEEIKGEINAHTDMGEVKLSKVVFTGKNDISTNSGNAALNISSIEQAESINVSADLGDISLKVPNNAKYNLETKISNNVSKHQIINGGGTKLKVVADLGLIKINGKSQ